MDARKFYVTGDYVMCMWDVVAYGALVKGGVYRISEIKSDSGNSFKLQGTHTPNGGGVWWNVDRFALCTPDGVLIEDPVIRKLDGVPKDYIGPIEGFTR